MDKEIVLEQAFDYYDAIVNTDISKVDGVNISPKRVKNLIHGYAYQRKDSVYIVPIGCLKK